MEPLSFAPKWTQQLATNGVDAVKNLWNEFILGLQYRFKSQSLDPLFEAALGLAILQAVYVVTKEILQFLGLKIAVFTLREENRGSTNYF